MLSSVKVPQLRCDLVPESSDIQAESGLSAEFLRHFCETDDLDLVTRLDIQVDSVQQNLEPLGEHLRNLRQLRLTDSSVMCARDLGTELHQLEILWMSRCGLQDLGGAASSLPSLRELYIPFNDISDLSPLSGHEHIEVLDLEGNAVTEFDEVAALGLCPRLRELTLRGNPLYRGAALPCRTVLGLLPRLAVLDDAGAEELAEADDAAWPSPPAPTADAQLHGPDGRLDGLGGGAVAASSGSGGGRPCGAEEHCSDGSCCCGADLEPVRPLQPSHPLLVERLQQTCAAVHSAHPYDGEPDEDELVVEGLKRARPKPSTFHAFTARPTVGKSLFSMQPPDRRQVRTADCDTMSFRPATAANSRLHFDDLKSSQDSASDLTCGGPLAGGPLTAVRQRRGQALGAQAAEPQLGIRQLLQRYGTYTQASCIPAEELLHRRREAEGRRPGTPDVRIHTPTVLQASRAGTGGGGAEGGGARAGGAGGAGAAVALDGGLSSPPAPREAAPPLPSAGGDRAAAVPPPSMITSLGETLFLDTETVVDLE